MGAKSEQQEIRKEIEWRLENMIFSAEHIPEMFYDDPVTGKVCKRNHSVRNKINVAGDIVRVNKLISLAME